MRERLRRTIEAIIEEELEQALGAARSQRAGTTRTGYRHGKRRRTFSTSLGATTIMMPCARVEDEDGRRREWRSTIIPRYQRRTERVDEAILGVPPERHQHAPAAWSAGAAAARHPAVEGCRLAPGRAATRGLHGMGPARSRRTESSLSVSGRLVSAGAYREKAHSVPVLVTLGVCAGGHRVILDLRLAGVESERAWLDAIQSLVARNLGAPVLAVIDGNPGLAAALKARWQARAATLYQPKLWNLLAKAPAHLREELAEDYRRMIYAESRATVEQARVGFVRKWRLRSKTVAASFEEAGEELFIFTAFPISQWKALRTTNALERINEEFRRRTKTQASLPNEEAVLLLLFGLLRSGKVTLRPAGRLV
jgi:putative transposase